MLHSLKYILRAQQVDTIIVRTKGRFFNGYKENVFRMFFVLKITGET